MPKKDPCFQGKHFCSLSLLTYVSFTMLCNIHSLLEASPALPCKRQELSCLVLSKLLQTYLLYRETLTVYMFDKGFCSPLLLFLVF